MRIANLTSVLDLYSSTGTDALNVSQLLSKMGHNVIIYTTDTALDRAEGVEIRAFRPFLRIRKFKVSLDLINEIKRMDFDVMHVHGYRGFEAVAASIIKKYTNTPLIISTFGTVPYVYSFGDKFFKMLEDALTGRLPLRSVDLLLAETEFEASELRKFGVPREKIRIVYEKVNVQKFRKIRSGIFGEEAPIVLFVGRICKIKNLELLIRAFAIVSREKRDVRLILVGPIEDEKYFQFLQNLIISLNIRKLVTFYGPVQNQNLPPIYSSAAVLVLPSWWENIGGVLIEAMACECPVVATNVGGVREVVPDGKAGFLVKLNEAKDMAERIERLISDVQLRKKMGREGRRIVMEKFSTEVFMKRLLSAYSDALLYKSEVSKLF